MVTQEHPKCSFVGCAFFFVPHQEPPPPNTHRYCFMLNKGTVDDTFMLGKWADKITYIIICA